MEYLRVAKKLITFKTTAENKKEIGRCLEYIKQYFKKSKLKIKNFDYSGAKGLIISHNFDTRPDILLVGHIDVVPAAPSQFKPQIFMGRLYGRGASDMKTLVAIMMQIIKNYQSTNNPLKLTLVINTDEEKGGKSIEKLLKNKKILPKFAIVPDGGNDFEIIIEEKGVMNITFETKGRPAHSSRPWEGYNAIVNSTSFYNQILKLYPLPTSSKEWKTSIVLSKMAGGRASNQIPGKALGMLDVRFIDSDPPRQILKYIKKIAKKNGVKIISTKIYSNFKIDPNNNFIQTWKTLTEKELARKVKIIKYSGSCDAKYFYQKKIPTLITKPVNFDIHGQKECIDLTSLNIFYKILTTFLNNYRQLGG